MVTPKSKQRTPGASPSLNDKRWQTLTMAHHTRSEQLIGKRFSTHASSQLIEALRSGKLRCMRESRTNPSERTLVPTTFWYGLRIDAEADLSLIQIVRGLPIQRNAPDLRTQVYDWVFYVWKPDYDRLWSPAKSVEKTTEMSEGPKSGPKPKKNWKLHVAYELYRIVEIDGKLPPAASYFADFCSVKLSYTPDPRAIQRLLKALL